MNNRVRSLVAGILLVLATPLAAAAPDARADAEIRHLVDFIAASGCQFIRNGDAHESKAAAEHLLMKYGKAKSRLTTAEQFIDKVASRSYLTGNEYRVRCPGKPEIASGSWLGAELQTWRQPAAAAKTAAR